MKIDHFALGSYQTNSFVLRADENAKTCVIIDTGLEADELADFLRENQLDIKAVILTHGHADHIVSLPVLKEISPKMEVLIHQDDAPMLTQAEKNLSALAGVDFDTNPADHILTDGQTLEIEGISLKVFHTPGHTPGGICLYCPADNIVFTGDTLFDGSVGRTDLPGGNPTQLIESIKSKLLDLPENTTVCPGHGPFTTIGKEKQTNPFLK